MENESLKLCDDLLNLASNDEDITGNSILDILKNYASTVSVYDMMAISSEIIKENQYVQENYKDESQKSYVKAFILRVNEIVSDNDNPPVPQSAPDV